MICKCNLTFRFTVYFSIFTFKSFKRGPTDVSNWKSRACVSYAVPVALPPSLRNMESQAARELVKGEKFCNVSDASHFLGFFKKKKKKRSGKNTADDYKDISSCWCCDISLWCTVWQGCILRHLTVGPNALGFCELTGPRGGQVTLSHVSAKMRSSPLLPPPPAVWPTWPPLISQLLQPFVRFSQISVMMQP